MGNRQPLATDSRRRSGQRAGQRWLVLLMAAAVAALLIARLAIAQVAEPPGLGVRDGQLAPCPGTPNCVSSQASDPQFRLEPLAFAGLTTAEARARLLAILAREQRLTIVHADASYIHAVFRSRLFGFPDDVEFFLAEPTEAIHYRSASRLGQGDLGVNRERMERIGREWNEGW